MSKKEVSLNEMLKDLIKFAEFCPDETQNLRLSRGLNVSIKKIKDVYHFAISRDKHIQPSMAEWKIVLNNMPFNKGGETPRIYKREGRTYFFAVLEK
jgi:hypothetical protein